MGYKLKLAGLGKKGEAPKLLSVFLDQVSFSVTTLLTTIVLARTYDKINYADLVLLFSVALFVLGFQSSIIVKPYAINLNDFKDGQHHEYYFFNMYLKLVFTALIILSFPLLYYLLFDSFDVTKLLLYLAYILGYTFYFFIREILLSERKTIQNLMYGLFCSISLIILLGVIYFNKITNVNVFLTISSLIYLITSGVYLVKNLKRVSLSKVAHKAYFKLNWHVGKWLLGSNMFYYLSSGIYPWLLLYITTKSDIAILGVLTSVSSIINPVLNAISSYLLPLFVRANLDYAKLHGMVKKWAFFFSGMAFILVILGYLFGQDIIVLFFGKKYAGLGMLVVYPFIVQAIHVIFQPFKISLNALKRTDVDFWLLMIRSVITIVVGFVLIKRYGLYGVFYTKIIENLFYQFAHFTIYYRLIKSKKPILESE